MQLKLAQGYRVGNPKMGQQAFINEFHYGARAGQGVPMKDPATKQPVLQRENEAFAAGLAWGRENRECRSVSVFEAGLKQAWTAYR